MALRFCVVKSNESRRVKCAIRLCGWSADSLMLLCINVYYCKIRNIKINKFAIWRKNSKFAICIKQNTVEKII